MYTRLILDFTYLLLNESDGNNPALPPSTILYLLLNRARLSRGGRGC